MRFPKLIPTPRVKSTLTRFYGLERTADVREGAFADLRNLTADAAPLLRTRPPRLVWTRSANGKPLPFPADGEITAAAAINDCLCWCTRTGVYLNGARVPGLTLDPAVKHRQIVGFGRNLFIAPDGKYIETDTGGAPSVVHASFSLSGQMRLDYEHAPDEEIPMVFLSVGPTPPENPAPGDRWLETAADDMILHVWDEDGDESVLPVYLTVSYAGAGRAAAAGDPVVLTGVPGGPRAYRVAFVQENKLWLRGAYFERRKETYALTLEKRMPVLDLAVEHNNRIWGCRYGENENGVFVNEIYACSLGDPASWEKFDGVSTDSYRVSLGSAGAFTGAAVLGGDVLFFKESSVIRVSGSVPSDFSVQVLPVRGVDRGAAASCVNLDGQIFYRSFDGITVFDGAMPYSVSHALGDCRMTVTAAAGFRGKYYLAATLPEAGRMILVYDTRTGMWHAEDDDLRVCRMVLLRQTLYYLCQPDPEALTYELVCADAAYAGEAADLFGGAQTESFAFSPLPAPSWFALGGPQGGTEETRILRGLVFRLRLEPGATFTAEILCNYGERPVRLCRLSGTDGGVITVPVNTPRCHTWQLRFSGVGGCTVYAVSQITERLHEVNGHG